MTGLRGSGTASALLAGASRRLRAAGTDLPGLDARLLLGEAMGVDAAGLIRVMADPVGTDVAIRFESLLGRRIDREPLSRILGRREFFGRSFRLDASVLDPRPDTETLIEAVLDRRGELAAEPRILDLGTGTGAILLTLLAEIPDATGVGVDIAPGAVEVARSNAAALGLSRRAGFAVSDWDTEVDGRFDLIVSNPPYIETAAIAGLAPEVALHEPRGALDGGTDGLEAYRAIAALAPGRLGFGGLLAVEIGHGQASSVASVFHDAGLESAKATADLGGRPRVVLARLQ